MRRLLVVCAVVLFLLGGVLAAAGSGSGSVTVTFRVLAPQLDFEIVRVTDGAAYNTPVTPGAVSPDPTATFYATLNGEHHPLDTAVMTEGRYRLVVTASNALGSTSTRSVAFEIDYTPPVITIDGVADEASYNHTVSATATTDEEADITLLLNGRPYEAGAPIDEEGDYVLEVSAVDRAGNTAATTVGFIVDLTPPDLTVIGVEDGRVYNRAVVPDALTTDPSAVISATLDGEPFALGSAVLAQGAYLLRAVATDPAGNAAVVEVAFVIDYSGERVDVALSAAVDRPAVALSWEATSGPEPASYGILRTVSEIEIHSAFAHAETTSTAYVDDRIRAGTLYYYRVLAFDTQGNEIGASNIATAKVGAELKRVWGRDRFGTASQVSSEAFEASDVVILATSRDFADALSAAGLAGSYRAPILLTRRDSLSQATRDEIVRLGASRAIIVGGTSAVGTPVEQALRSAGLTVDRVAGATRYETSVAVAREIARNESALGRPRSGQVFLARGDLFPDALSVSPLAYTLRAPIFLTRPNSLPSAVSSYVAGQGFDSVVVSGGTLAVSNAVANRFATAGGMEAVRIGGGNRYETSTLISSHGVEQGWANWKSVGLATGTDFPDALSGSVLIGEMGGVLMITPPNRLHPLVAGRLSSNPGDVFDVRIFGGTLAVCSEVESTVSQFLR